jgi:hypothetical protein
MRRAWLRRVFVAGAMLGSALGSIGCQVDWYGLTLPSPRYLKDDVQYFAPGPDFPLANEEAAVLEENAP